MIVVEGCDGTGKTTLAEQLATDLGLTIGTRGTRNRDELYKVTRQDTYKALSHAVYGGMDPQIWDRLGPFSDPIYSRIMDRDCAFSAKELQFIHSILKDLRCPIIFCHVPLDVAEENQLKVHQMDGVNNNFPFLHGLYEGVMAAQHAALPNVYTYDYRVEDAYKSLLGNMRSYITKRKEREWRS
jgi:hypothetical protein